MSATHTNGQQSLLIKTICGKTEHTLKPALNNSEDTCKHKSDRIQLETIFKSCPLYS